MGLLCMGYVYVFFVYGVWVCVSFVVYGGIEVWGYRGRYREWGYRVITVWVSGEIGVWGYGSIGYRGIGV